MPDLNAILDLYREPLFWQFPVASSLLSVAAFLLFALPLTWIAWRDPVWARKYRIQPRRMDVPRWFWPSLGRLLVNSGVTFLLILPLWPLLRLSNVHAGPLPPWWEVAWQLLFFVYLDDFLFYWMHRALHTPKLFRHVHAVHHRVRTPCAVAGVYFHWMEYAAISSLVLVGPLLVGAHVVTLYIWVVLRQLEAASGHCGYDWPFEPLRLLPLYDGNGYHDYHHGSFKGNYAGAVGWLDRVFGTSSAGYAEYEQRRRQGMFPADAGRADAV